MNAAPPNVINYERGKTWRVGTLTYTRSGLANVFFWLLWGDLVLTLMDGGVVSNVVVVQLKAVGASNATIGSNIAAFMTEVANTLVGLGIWKGSA